MRDPDRIAPTLAEIERVWRAYPDYRLGQLICVFAGRYDIDLVWNIEDDELVHALRFPGK